MPSAPTTNQNNALHQLLVEAAGIQPVWTGDAQGNAFGWLHLGMPEKLKDVAGALAGKARLCTITAYAEERGDPNKRRRIAYHFVVNEAILLTVTIPVFDPETLDKLPVPSITPWFLNADWNEREFVEMFDIDIVGHPNPRRLFLDERLDAGIMSKLIPFSVMAHGAGSNTLWEQVLEAKGVPLEERRPSLVVPAEPIKATPKVTPVSATESKDEPVATTLAAVAAPAPEKPAPEQAPQAQAEPVQAEPAPKQAQAVEAAAPAPAPGKSAKKTAPAKAAAPAAKSGKKPAPKKKGK